ncbi:hypothetical protein K6N13_31440 [Rhizobium sp. 8Z]|nr:hypothetical protein [Rhizobium redzepovicii]
MKTDQRLIVLGYMAGKWKLAIDEPVGEFGSRKRGLKRCRSAGPDDLVQESAQFLGVGGDGFSDVHVLATSLYRQPIGEIFR